MLTKREVLCLDAMTKRRRKKLKYIIINNDRAQQKKRVAIAMMCRNRDSATRIEIICYEVLG